MLMTALAPMAGASILPAVASTGATLAGAGGLLSGLGGLKGVLGGFGDAITGLPASNLFGIADSPMAGVGKLLGGGLLGDFSGVGRSAMLGGQLTQKEAEQLNQQGMQMNQMPEPPQFAFPQNIRNIMGGGAITEQEGLMLQQLMNQRQGSGNNILPPVMNNNQQMLQPLNTQIDPRTIMSGLLAPRNYNI
nr:hypothetical protein [uncultured Mediterranean phage uvMED]